MSGLCSALQGADPALLPAGSRGEAFSRSFPRLIFTCLCFPLAETRVYFHVISVCNVSVLLFVTGCSFLRPSLSVAE